MARNMAKQTIVVYLLIAYLQVSYQASTPDSPTYRGAVVEFTPFFSSDVKSILHNNSDSYVTLIKNAAEQDVDIIVFPEDALTTIYLPNRKYMDSWTTLIPSPTENYVPCGDNDTIPVSDTLKKISCAARDNKIYVVINIAEKLPCSGTGCPENKMLYYNSNVAFDRTGKIIARYRKTNLFKEPQFNVTPKPEIVIFDTDFGVKFGTFICFDLLFKEPALTLTRKYNVTDFVYPTAWFSQLPFLTAIQTQMGWAYSEDVNLLAAGYNHPVNGNGGSGIYLGKKLIAKATMPKMSKTEMLVVDIPKKSKHNMGDEKTGDLNVSHEHMHDKSRNKRDKPLNEDNKFTLFHDNITFYSTKLFNTSVEGEELCNNNFCCKFNIVLENVDPDTKYRMVTSNGVRWYNDEVPLGVTACGIVQCANDTVESCYSTSVSKTHFKNIEISTVFQDYENVFVMPSMLEPSLFPIKEFQYNVHRHKSYANISVSLTVPRNNIVTFGIYSRNFTKDGKSNIASTIGAQIIMITFSLWVLSNV